MQHRSAMMALAPATVPNSGSRASSLPSPGEQELSVPTTRGPRPPPPRLPHPDLPASGARDRCPTGPLAPDQPTSLSPHAAEILTQRSLTFSLGASLSYPLSIDPPLTWRGLAFCASFGLLLIGTARALSRDSAFGLSGAFAVLGAALAVVGIVQKATFNGKIYGFWELVRGGAPFGAHGSIGIVRARPESADRLVALFTSKRPFLCRRCGWRARRDWTDEALRKLTNYGAGGAEPDPLLASLDLEAAPDHRYYRSHGFGDVRGCAVRVDGELLRRFGSPVRSLSTLHTCL